MLDLDVKDPDPYSTAASAAFHQSFTSTIEVAVIAVTGRRSRRTSLLACTLADHRFRRMPSAFTLRRRAIKFLTLCHLCEKHPPGFCTVAPGHPSQLVVLCARFGSSYLLNQYPFRHRPAPVQLASRRLGQREVMGGCITSRSKKGCNALGTRTEPLAC